MALAGAASSLLTGEAQQITRLTEFRSRHGAREAHGLCYATDTSDDSVALEAWLNTPSGRIVFKIEDAIVNGTGSGMPLGF